MKKLIALLMVFAMCASLAACGGADKQPAVDAFNKTSEAFDEIVELVNKNPDAIDQEAFDTMNEMSELLRQHKELLESDEEIEEDTLNEMIEWYGTVEKWVADVKEAFDQQEGTVSE